MSTKGSRLLLALLLSLGAGLGLAAATAGSGPEEVAAPVGTAFTYQGRLTDGDGRPATGPCDFYFGLWDDPDEGNELGSAEWLDAELEDGRFTALLDFGSAFDGTALWLEVEVQCPGDAALVELSPRQPLTAAPLAVHADLLAGQPGAFYLDAGNLDAGTLDPGRYSAYADLAAEGYLDGADPGDVLTRAQGDNRFVNEAQDDSVTSGMIVDGQVAAGDLEDGAALAEIVDDDGSGSGLDADTVDGLHAGNLARTTYGTLDTPGSGSASVTIEIPHWTPFTLHLSSGWPDDGGVAFVQGFENDYYVGVTYIAYNGDGTSSSGGAECAESGTNTLLTFGSGPYSYSVKCPGENSGAHNLVLTASGTPELRYTIMY